MAQLGPASSQGGLEEKWPPHYGNLIPKGLVGAGTYQMVSLSSFTNIWSLFLGLFS